MRRILTEFMRVGACYVVVVLLASSCFVFGQDQESILSPPQQQTSAPAPGWQHFSGPPRAQAGDPPNQNDPLDPNDPQSRIIPSRLVIRPGAFITVRIDQMLSSKRNRAGDRFTATLVKPVVVDGLVVAQRGETVGGRVVEAQKAGRIKGVSQLAVRLTDLTLVDGQQTPVQSQLIGQRAPTSRGRDAGALAATTALGAAIGGAASGGIGAAVGAGAGAIAGTVGILLTRGHPVVIYPESLLTFRVEAPVNVSTLRDPEAFRNVEEDAYARPSEARNLAPAPRGACGSYYGCLRPSAYYNSYYNYGSYPFYYGFAGPSFYPYYFGSTFYYGRGGFYGFGRRGFYGRRH